MSLTKDFKKNPQEAVKIYTRVIVPLKEYLEKQIRDKKLDVDINDIYDYQEIWKFFCNDTVKNISNRIKRLKKSEAYDKDISHPKPAFIFYSNERREEMNKKHPGQSVPQISKILGSEWKAMSDEAKKPYNDLYQKDRERFLKERGEAYDKAVKEGKIKTRLGPKKPHNAYIFFMQDAEVQAKVTKQLAKSKEKTDRRAILKNMWDSMAIKDKKRYEDMFDNDKIRYQKELAAYNSATTPATTNNVDLNKFDSGSDSDSDSDEE